MANQQNELVRKLLGTDTVLCFCPPCTGSRPEGVGLCVGRQIVGGQIEIVLKAILPLIYYSCVTYPRVGTALPSQLWV